MLLRIALRAALLAAVVVFSHWGAGAAQAVVPAPPLFANDYVGPPGAPAQLYVSPRPAPPLVGHTWITYQALMPHELLYHHHRAYYRYYPNGGYSVTRVKWH
jgi:hypothetical protein